MGTPDMGMVIRAGKLWTTWGKIEACMTRKKRRRGVTNGSMLQGLESPCFLAFLIGLIIKKENEMFHE